MQPILFKTLKHTIHHLHRVSENSSKVLLRNRHLHIPKTTPSALSFKIVPASAVRK